MGGPNLQSPEDAAHESQLKRLREMLHRNRHLSPSKMAKLSGLSVRDVLLHITLNLDKNATKT